MKKRVLASLAGLTIAAAVLPVGATGAFGANSSPVVYSSVPANGVPSNVASVGEEAYAFNQIGNEVTLADGPRKLSNVVVTLSSWACVSGSWALDNCVTPPGSTFNLPITLNVYASDGSGIGALLATSTQTFSIPYRPSASATCDAMGLTGEWYQPSSKTCYHGIAANVTFSFGGNVALPDTIVYGIAYNTTHYGYAPQGESAACFASSGGCPYDSLNVALTQDPTDVSAGSDPAAGTIWVDYAHPSYYCDGGAAGSGFRQDSPGFPTCWAVGGTTPSSYVPAVQIKAGGSKS